MNEYDSTKMVDVLREAAGYEITDDPNEADLLLLNTCSVREKAQEKVFSQLGGWRQLKKAKPDLLIGVGGCVASQEGDGITRRAPYVDLVFGPQTLHRLPAMIDETIQSEQYHVFPGTTMTVCALTLRNGYIVTGESAAASPENFNQEIGRKIARDNARNKIWALEGYLLREKLSR